MPSNSIAPSWIDIYYESTLGTHKMKLPVSLVDPGVPGGTFELFLKDNTQQVWGTSVLALVTLLKPHMHSTTTFQYAELWSMPVPGAAPVYQDTYSIAVAGTSATATVPASQTVWSMRTDLGGKAFLYLMDTTSTPNNKYKAPSYGNAAVLAVVNFLIGNSNFIIGRDNGYPVTVTKVLTKTNDALRRRYRLV